MEWIFLGIVIFLFLLAAFDLYVGVSNDAVNFLNSALGSRTARFRTLVIIASVGVFAGCVLSNGMMDIARHGIFVPRYFSFREVMYIYMAVMVTDIVLLDRFNTYGMPTSTTVSMVFELLGASFAFTLIKLLGDATGSLAVADYLNTSKALEVIMGIFLSVPVAFIFGSIVQWLARLLFSFRLCDNSRWKMGLFGGMALTAIVYFMLFKGLKDLSFMTAGVKDFINDNAVLLLSVCFVVASLLMFLLQLLRVNVLRVVVLSGTFALATAFAGNDLVNFIGVPLAGFSSYLDYSSSAGVTPSDFMMHSLQNSASTPFFFLVVAGGLMVFSLATSPKAKAVAQTEIGLSGRDEGSEMFGSSRMARSLVRWGLSFKSFVGGLLPQPVRALVERRFRPQPVSDNGAAYDQLRASINLVVASLLIALGTSLKLPLSTTFVTFMVAMGTSLADRAWSRESAVFRITGVLTVIGGWFITAGVAFTACFFVALAMNYGGMVAVSIMVVLAIYAVVHSQRRFKSKQEVKAGDVLFTEILNCQDRTAVLPMLERHLSVSAAEQVREYAALLGGMTDALFAEEPKPLRRAEHTMEANKRELKNLRRREIICLRRAESEAAVRLSTTFHSVHNSLRQILYGLLRICEPAREHVENHFTPVDREQAGRYRDILQRLLGLMERAADNLRNCRYADYEEIRRECVTLREEFSALRSKLLRDLQSNADANLSAMTLLLHVVQETELICAEVRRVFKSVRRFSEWA